LGGSPARRILVFKKIIEKTDGQWRVGLREHRLDEPTWSDWITWNFNEWSVPGPCFGRFRMGLGVVFGMKHWGLDGCKVRNSFDFLGDFYQNKIYVGGILWLGEERRGLEPIEVVAYNTSSW